MPQAHFSDQKIVAISNVVRKPQRGKLSVELAILNMTAELVFAKRNVGHYHIC